MPPRRPTVRVAAPAPPRTLAFPRSFLVFTLTRVFAGHDVLQDLVDIGLTRALTRRVPISGTIWRLIRPVSVTIVVAFFGRPPLPRRRLASKSLVKLAELFDRDRLVVKLPLFQAPAISLLVGLGVRAEGPGATTQFDRCDSIAWIAVLNSMLIALVMSSSVETAK